MTKSRTTKAAKEREQIHYEEGLCLNNGGPPSQLCCINGRRQENGDIRNCVTVHAPPGPDELSLGLFKTRFGSDGSLRNKKANIRRGATHLRNAIEEFDKALNVQQRAAIEAAINVFDELGDEIGQAVLAEKMHHEKIQANYIRERQIRLDKIADDFFGIADEAGIIAIAKDLVAFTSDIGTNWYKQRTSNEDATAPQLIDRLSDPIRRFLKAPTPQTLKEIKTRAAEYIEEFHRRHRYFECTSINDFHLFRAWLAKQHKG